MTSKTRPVRPLIDQALLTCGLLFLGGLGGWVAFRLSLPLPWMLGALLTSGLLVLIRPPAVLNSYEFPTGFRQIFVGLIGVMIGTQVTPDLLQIAPKLPYSLAGLALYVALAFALNYVIFSRFGQYDRATALFASAPGGLMEIILMGEAAGARINVLVVQQFLRVIVVIIWMPLGLSLWLGYPVGSAAGESLSDTLSASGLWDYLITLPLAWIAMWGATKLRLPAAPLMGPLLVTALLNLTGVTELVLPDWMVAVAQLVIGASLGLRFKGVDRKILRQALVLAHFSVACMLIASCVFATALMALSGLTFLPLFVSFAPGGLAEMAVIALSLDANPAIVSLHHIARILMTIVAMPIAARLLGIPLGPTKTNR